MFQFKSQRFLPAKSVATGILLTILLGGHSNLLAARLPTMAEVKALVEKHLHSNVDYASGDLISRKEVEPIFDDLLSLGVPLSTGQEELYDDFVPDSAPLVRALRTPNGRKFMQKVKAIPGVYDRLERLSWNSQGKELIDKLIGDPQGPEMLKVLLEPTGKAVIAKYLNDDPSGKNFSIPTGHVHTANELLRRLDAVLAREQKK